MDFRIGPVALARRMAQQEDLLKMLGIEIERLTMPGDVVLDPMCGSGVLLMIAKRLGRKPVGFDIAPDMAKFARKLTGGDVRVGDATKLPIQSNALKLITTSFPSRERVEYSGQANALERKSSKDYIAGMLAILVECRRVLRPEGMLVLVQAPEQTWMMVGLCRRVELPTRFLMMPGAV